MNSKSLQMHQRGVLVASVGIVLVTISQASLVESADRTRQSLRSTPIGIRFLADTCAAPSFAQPKRPTGPRRSGKMLIADRNPTSN
jgi:hypothetical protein